MMTLWKQSDIFSRSDLISVETGNYIDRAAFCWNLELSALRIFNFVDFCMWNKPMVFMHRDMLADDN